MKVEPIKVYEAQEPNVAVREFLDRVDEMLMALSYHDRHAAVNVLSAIRGNDNRDDALYKMWGTAVIRSKAFPAAFDPLGHNIALDVNDLLRDHVQVQGNTTVSGGFYFEHFHSHLKEAAQALGLKVVVIRKE